MNSISALGQAVHLAKEISTHPQQCLRVDRDSAIYGTFSARNLSEALQYEGENALKVISHVRLKRGDGGSRKQWRRWATTVTRFHQQLNPWRDPKNSDITPNRKMTNQTFKSHFQRSWPINCFLNRAISVRKIIFVKFESCFDLLFLRNVFDQCLQKWLGNKFKSALNACTGIDRGCPEVCQRPRPPRKVQRLPGHREGGLAEGVGPDGGRREQEERVKNSYWCLLSVILPCFVNFCQDLINSYWHVSPVVIRCCWNEV